MCCDLTMGFIIAYTPLIPKFSLLRSQCPGVYLQRVSSLLFRAKWMQEHFNHYMSKIPGTDLSLL